MIRSIARYQCQRRRVVFVEQYLTSSYQSCVICYHFKFVDDCEFEIFFSKAYRGVHPKKTFPEIIIQNRQLDSVSESC